MASKVNVHSSVPVEIRSYHRHLQQAFALRHSQPPSALESLWLAFEEHLEPQGLQLALELLQPWPEARQSLQLLAHLLYPQVFADRSQQPSTLFTVTSPANLDLPESIQPFLFPAERPRLSVCMIVRDEAPVLSRALASVSALADEIIVCDTGSSDGSQAIARTFAKVRLCEIPWQDDFALARNQSLTLAQGDWILVLDADEILPAESADYIHRLLAYPPLGWQVFNLHIRHEQDDQPMALTPASRIFRNSEQIRFAGALHERPIRQHWPWWLLPVFLPLELQHSGNRQSVYLAKNKAARLTQLETLLATTATPYLRYQYAHLRFQSDPEAPEVESQLQQALCESLEHSGQIPPRADWQPAPLDYTVLLLLQIYTRQRRFAEVLALYHQVPQAWRFIASFYLLARAAQAMQEHTLAREAYFCCWDPHLVPLQIGEDWEREIWEGLQDLALVEQDGLTALFALRQLLKKYPSGQVPERAYDLYRGQDKLRERLKLPSGTWLDRLDFEIRQHLKTYRLKRVAEMVLFYLCESWDRTVLGDALRLLQYFGEPELATQLSQLAKLLYPTDPLFQMRDLSELGPAYSQDFLPGRGLWRRHFAPPASQPSLSVCMIVRDAAETLPQALASVAAVATEFVIADTGSKDKTLAILQAWGQDHPLQLLQLEWRHDFGWARNQVLEAATQNWILILDADEELLPESLPVLRQLCAYPAPGLQIFAVLCESLRARPEWTQRDWLPRLFCRHPAIRYWGSVHEHPGHAYVAERLPVHPLEGVRLLHRGYLPAAIERHRKWERNDLLADNLKISGLPNPYFLYHQANVWLEGPKPELKSQGLEMLQQALRETERFHSRPPVPGWFPAPIRKVRLMLFRHWHERGQASEIIELYSRNDKRSEDPEYYFYAAAAYLQRQQLDVAAQLFKSCRALHNLSYKSSLPAAGFATWRPLLGLIEIARRQKHWAWGLDLWQELLGLKPSPVLQKLYAEWWQRMLQEASI